MASQSRGSAPARPACALRGTQYGSSAGGSGHQKAVKRRQSEQVLDSAITPRGLAAQGSLDVSLLSRPPLLCCLVHPSFRPKSLCSFTLILHSFLRPLSGIHISTLFFPPPLPPFCCLVRPSCYLLFLRFFSFPSNLNYFLRSILIIHMLPLFPSVIPL